MGEVDRGGLQKVYWEYALAIQACNFGKGWIYQILGNYHLNLYNMYHDFKF